jgi:hypothetical protein
MSMIQMDLDNGNSSNNVHKWVYANLRDSITWEELLDSRFESVTLIYGIYLLIKLVGFLYFYYIATEISVLRDKSAITLRTLNILNMVDLKLLFIPITIMNLKNIGYSSRSFWLKFFSVEIILVQGCLIFIELFLTYDYKFEKTALN